VVDTDEKELLTPLKNENGGEQQNFANHPKSRNGHRKSKYDQPVGILMRSNDL
jgi:hypothetical protein